MVENSVDLLMEKHSFRYLSSNQTLYYYVTLRHQSKLSPSSGRVASLLKVLHLCYEKKTTKKESNKLLRKQAGDLANEFQRGTHDCSYIISF